jgi:hypothetical protein
MGLLLPSGAPSLLCLMALPVVDRLRELFTLRRSGKFQFLRNLENTNKTTFFLAHFLCLIFKRHTCYEYMECTRRHLTSYLTLYKDTSNLQFGR